MKKINSFKPNICIISPSLLETGTNRGGGAEVTDYNVALQLSKIYKVSIISAYFKDYLKEKEVNPNFVINQVRFSAQKNYPPKSTFESHKIFIFTYIYSFLVALIVLRFCCQGLQLLIVHNPKTSLISVILAKLFKIKLLYSEGNIVPWTSPLFEARKSNLQKLIDEIEFILTKWICKECTIIRAQSNSIKRGMIMNGLNPAKIEVIAAGVNIDEFLINRNRGLNEDIIRVGFIGRLSEIKGAPLLLDIVKRSIDELPYVRFLIFGEGPFKKFFSNMPNVEHLGFVYRDQLKYKLKKVNFVLFFQTELGRAEIEALAAEKVIIACNIGEVPNILEHLKNAFLCEPTASSYLNAIKILSKDPIVAAEISKNAGEITAKMFSWEKIGNQWLSICKNILQTRTS